MWMNREPRPPVPPSRSLAGGNEDLAEEWFGALDEPEYFTENNSYEQPQYRGLEMPAPNNPYTTQMYNTGQIYTTQAYIDQQTLSSYNNPTQHYVRGDIGVPESPTSCGTLSPPHSSSALSSPSSTVPSPMSPHSPPQHMPPMYSPQTPSSMDVKPVIIHEKRKNNNGADIEQWSEYVSPAKRYFELYDERNNLISNAISLRIRISADNLEYSQVDNAHIMYRQNQFQLEIDFIGGLTTYTTTDGEQYYILQNNGMPSLVPTSGLFFYIYSVKHQRGQPFDPDPVELLQSCGPRNQKEVQAPGLCPIINGRAVYSKLQFRAATANNARTGKQAQNIPNPQQQFYRIIIALVAKTETSHEFVISRISPFLLVRGQNPGRFAKPLPPIPATPPATPLPVSAAPAPLAPLTPLATLATTAPTVPTKPKRPKNKTAQPKAKRARQEMEEEEDDQETPEDATTSGWAKGQAQDTISIVNGKVGINTKTPAQALSVVGNIMLTGEIMKPSDQRVKTNIQPVSTASQLANIEKLQIYDYELIHGKEQGKTNDTERGILAQQLQQIIPSATRTVKGVQMADGQVVDELIVVQERALLYENLGATKELSTMVKKDQALIKSIVDAAESRAKSTDGEKIATQQTLNAAGKLLEYLVLEKDDETRRNEKDTLCCIFVTHTNKGFYGSLFSLGPAWSLYLLGFFVPLCWLVGSFFVLSSSKKKKLAGTVHFITAILFAVLVGLVWSFYDFPSSPFIISFAFGAVATAVIGLRWNYRRSARTRRLAARRRMEAKQQKLNIDRATKSASNQPYMSIPMEALPQLDAPALSAALNAVTLNAPSAKAVVAASNNKLASLESDWERNTLLTQASSSANPWV